jgi:pSer/pThr/pTyr-binding forkhead associated (FHA) protein
MRGYVLTDLSRNGTFVNGRRINGSRALRVGDVVRVGDEELQFEAGRVMQDAAATPARLPARSSVEAPTPVRPPVVGAWRRLANLWRA